MSSQKFKGVCMNHKALIADAWRMTQLNKQKFFWFGFLLGFITIFIETCWMLWQYYSFSNAPNLTGKELNIEGYLNFFRVFTQQYTGFTPWIITGIIAIIVWWFLIVPIIEGGLIVMIKRAYDGLEIKRRQGVSEGILNFFKLFAFHNLISFVFNVFSIVSYITIPLKFFSWSAFYFILIPGILWIVAALIGNILMIYTRFFLVLRGMHVGQAINASARYVIRYFSETLMVFVFLFIIMLRVLVNIVLVFIVPVFITSVLAYFIQAVVGYKTIIIITIGGLMMVVTAWIYGSFRVFTEAVWEYTFLELEKKDREFEAEQSENG